MRHGQWFAHLELVLSITLSIHMFLNLERELGPRSSISIIGCSLTALRVWQLYFHEGKCTQRLTRV